MPHRRTKRRRTEGEGHDVSSGKGRDIADTTIEDLPDDILISILSQGSLKDAITTSVLSRKWRHLWKFTFGRLDFEFLADDMRKAKRFIECVNRVLELHQAPEVNTFFVRWVVDGFYTEKKKMMRSTALDLDRWISHAMKKKSKNLEIQSWGYEFPSMHKLKLPDSYDFSFLKSLKLKNVNVEDEIVHYFLASCINLERVSIKASDSTKELQFIDPLPKLKFLEISACVNIRQLKISVASLVSVAYSGLDTAVRSANISDHTEISFGGSFCQSFLYGDNTNTCATYSSELARLQLNLPHISHYTVLNLHNLSSYDNLKTLKITTGYVRRRSLLFFTMLIKACPILQEFRLKINYEFSCKEVGYMFPEVNSEEAPIFLHKNLKLVELEGCKMHATEKKLLERIAKIAPFLAVVVIGTVDGFRNAKGSAEKLRRRFPPETQLIIQ